MKFKTQKFKSKIGIAIASVLAVAILVTVWNIWFAPTRIAFVNYQITTLGQIAKSNNSRFIKIQEVSVDDLSSLRKADMVFVNGMGLRLTAEQREELERMSEKIPTLTTAATNPDNCVVSIDSIDSDTLVRYLNNGGRANYRSMLCYVRQNIDGKHAFCKAPQPVAEPEHYVLYHPDVEHPNNENEGFNSMAEYETYLRKHHLFNAKGNSIVITGQMGDPTDLIASFEKEGYRVYPVNSMRSFVLGGQIDSVHPSAIINMAHGRLGDYMTQWLESHNVPLFTTVYVPQLTDDWEADKMGMSGGFLSQSIVTPEIDGAIRPYAIFAHRINKEGIQEIYAIPSRLQSFVASVGKHIALQTKPNSQKRIAIYYFKGPGQSALSASGLEVVPSLYNLLQHLRQNGYRVDNLPSSPEALEQMIQRQGSVLGTYAEGAFDRFMKEGNPAWVTADDFSTWCDTSIGKTLKQQLVQTYGPFPGQYMSSSDGNLAVARLQFGNIVLLPQPMAGLGDNEFKIVHGTDQAPPYPYVASYLWVRHAFGADAILHFGTHGSLEYTPRKQVALCDNDWPDRLIGPTPHFYLYTIGNVGEALIAKRRTYASIISHLTPPFMESGLRSSCQRLNNAIQQYYKKLEGPGDARRESMEVKKIAVEMGIHRSLELDSVLTHPYSEEEIIRIENFAEELAAEKNTGHPYILGIPYENKSIENSLYAMCVDPIAYSLFALDKLRDRATDDATRHQRKFSERYITPSRILVSRLIANPNGCNDKTICQVAQITQRELDDARAIHEQNQPIDMMSMMLSLAEEVPNAQNQHIDQSNKTSADTPQHEHKKQSFMQRMGKHMSPEKSLKMAKMMGASDEQLAKMKAAMSQGKRPAATPKSNVSSAVPQMTEEEKYKLQMAEAIVEIERTIKNVGLYKSLLQTSPQKELDAVVNALNGGYTFPSPGGDPIVNPNTLPTGRNLYGINVENTPSEIAWEKGKALVNNTLKLYRQRHNDSLPRKVSYTLWSGEFIETEGATIAQVLYMLGVEPVRDAFGRVTDLRLIPAKELGRPRIDVCVQTSGQLRDLAASRLFLINRAVEMAATANDKTENYVAQGIRESERRLVDKGLSPAEARQIAAYRVFGGVNGGYGTGIQGMVQAGDQWEKESEIAETYLNNMGAYYGSEQDWESVRQFAFEAALSNTDAVVQPRQSNTWGALSLDHVYEFMGGMNLAVRNITGKDPDAYLSDYRNRNNARIQEVKEAIGVESRTTLFNPNYIREMMNGGATSANAFDELIQNTFGWNVMKPQAIDNEIWDEIYNVYVKDCHKLGVQQFFEKTNPAALQNMTAVMMETARKGLWKASEEQLKDIAQLHTELVDKHLAACTPMVCDNAKLRDFIAQHSAPEQAKQYQRNIRQARETATGEKGALRLKKEQLNPQTDSHPISLSNILVGVAIVAAIGGIVLFLRRQQKRRDEEENEN